MRLKPLFVLRKDVELEQSDQEQVEALQQWWRDNWLSLIGGLVVGLGAILGWQYYGDYTASQAAAASSQFEMIKTQLATDQNEQAKSTLKTLQAEHAKSPYVAQAHLAMAQAQAEDSDWAGAAASLQQVLASTQDEALLGLARLRLARAQWAQGEADAAMSTLDQEAGAYAGLFSELKGDIAKSQGDAEAAREHWQAALLAQPQVVDPNLIQRKLDAL